MEETKYSKAIERGFVEEELDYDAGMFYMPTPLGEEEASKIIWNCLDDQSNNKAQEIFSAMVDKAELLKSDNKKGLLDYLGEKRKEFFERIDGNLYKRLELD